MEEWEDLSEGNYYFIISGRSILFDTVASSTYSFTISPSSSSRSLSSSSSRQITTNITCSPTLWDSSPNTIYGIQTYPSGKSLYIYISFISLNIYINNLFSNIMGFFS